MDRRGFLTSTAAGVAGAGLIASRTAAAVTREAEQYIGVSMWDLPTPALVVDARAMESNLATMEKFLAGKAASLRPHTKTHKSPLLARKQMEHGAVGICTAKVSEAEVMLEEGIGDILITSPVVTRDKIQRVIALASRSKGVAIVVDRPGNVIDLDQAAEAAGIELTVLIELDTGTQRTGVTMGAPAMELLDAVARSRHLNFGGIQAYAGEVQHLKGYEFRRLRSRQALERALEMRHAFERAGHDVPVFSVGGTGTYNIDAEIEGVTDIQAGSYLFMDVDYRAIGGQGGEVYDDFAPALFVLATAISQPMKGRITVDAGYKAMAVDKTPVLRDYPGNRYRFAGDEHGIVDFGRPGPNIGVGDKVVLIASHCDPTVNLYDHYFACRNEKVEAVWPVAGRGRSQ